MQTPILDFLRQYAEQKPARFHMPGHKGTGPLGFEQYDITEVSGADELFHAEGIIAESEANASGLFGCPTFYSAAGSTMCIQAMLCLALQWKKEQLSGQKKDSGRVWILAARNAHKAFVNASALLDMDIEWLRPAGDGPYYSHVTAADEVEQILKVCTELPAAVYLTSPDYLGHMCDIRAIAEVCHRYGVLLLVDNAHGSYLHFLPETLHPMDLGADLCCDSAHKTLPVLTGGAYLHIGTTQGEEQTKFFTDRAKDACALFGSSSPSYLIMASLDACNAYLETLPEEMKRFLELLQKVRKSLEELGVKLTGDEPLKLTIEAASISGNKEGSADRTGNALAAHLESHGIHPEFCDPDYVVLMLSTKNTEEDFNRLLEALRDWKKQVEEKVHTGVSTGIESGAEKKTAPRISLPERVLSPREAILSPKETLPVEQCLGRISAAAAISCPPAVPIVVCGERIDEQVLECFKYYGITHCTVSR